MASNMTGFPAGSPVNSEERHTAAQFPLGTRCVSDGGAKEWVYVRAGGAIAAKEFVRCGQEADPFEAVVKVEGAAQIQVLGLATAAFDDNAYGFVQTRGVGIGLVKNNDAAGSLLVSGTTAAGTLELAVAGSLAGAKSIACLVAAADSQTAGTSVYMN